MKPDDLCGVSEEESVPDIEEILVRFDSYVVMLVQKRLVVVQISLVQKC